MTTFENTAQSLPHVCDCLPGGNRARWRHVKHHSVISVCCCSPRASGRSVEHQERVNVNGCFPRSNWPTDGTYTANIRGRYWSCSHYGARGEQHANNVSFSEKKTLIRALTMPRSQRDDYHLLSRKQQVIVMRLRTGHNRLNSHMHRKLKLAPSPTCPCGQDEQTTEHVLQRCPIHKATREDVWPVSTSLTTKLRLQTGAGEDDIIHLPSGLDRVDCENQEEEEGPVSRRPTTVK